MDNGTVEAMALDPDQRLVDVVSREQSRLRRFIHRRVRDPRDVEDILQDVFAELVEANRLLMPIDHVTAWLFRVARNRIIDLFRKKRPEAATAPPRGDANGLGLEDLLPAPDGGPDAAYTRQLLVDALEEAIAELPEPQRIVFVAHELEGRTFKDLAAETGLSVNTLLSRKHYAVRRLRARLRAVHDELTT